MGTILDPKEDGLELFVIYQSMTHFFSPSDDAGRRRGGTQLWVVFSYYDPLLSLLNAPNR